MYLLLDENKRVKELIPDINPLFPNLSIEKRYSKDIVNILVHVSDDLVIEEGYKFNEETRMWEYVDLPESMTSSSIAKSPSELREQAYNTDLVISWNNEMITVTQAAQLWQYYAAEGSDKATELSALIAEAKQTIRDKYPD